MKIKCAGQKGFLALLLLAGMGTGYSLDCAPKISPKLCAQLNEASGTQFKVRIVLDASQEQPYSKTEKRPLLVWTEHLMENHALFSIANPDSVYSPELLSLNPSTESVQYHNVTTGKSEIEKIADEPYVKTIEQGCNRGTSHNLCTAMNEMPDTGKISFRLYFQDSLELDSTERAAYLSRFDLYHPKFKDSLLTGAAVVRPSHDGYCARVSDLKSISWDKEVRFLELWFESGSLKNRPRESRIRLKAGSGHRYQINGRRVGQRGFKATEKVLQAKE